jgi:hypothetical protein
VSSVGRIAENPFYILGLPPGCARAEVEREGQKLLGMLELKLSAAQTYQTPLGPQPRTIEQVRQAMAELRDPEKRLAHELWARLPATTAPATAESPATERPTPARPRKDPWEKALIAFGWRPR